MPTRGRDWQRLTGPRIHPLQRTRRINFKSERVLGRRGRKDLDGNIDDQAQSSQRAGVQTGHVIAGNVFHDCSTKAQRRALIVQHGHAQYKVFHRASSRTPWAGQARGHHATDGAAPIKARGLKCQHLLGLGQHALDLGNRRAASGHHDQLRGVVIHDAAVAGGVEAMRRFQRRLTIKRFAAVALDGDGLPCTARSTNGLGRLANPVGGLLGCGGAHGQKRGRSGNFNAPRCTCIFPYSAHRDSVGMALPGLSSPAGSKARLTEKKLMRSSGEN